MKTIKKESHLLLQKKHRLDFLVLFFSKFHPIKSPYYDYLFRSAVLQAYWERHSKSTTVIP